MRAEMAAEEFAWLSTAPHPTVHAAEHDLGLDVLKQWRIAARWIPPRSGGPKGHKRSVAAF